MLIGLKSTGKSMLADYIYNSKGSNEVVILDCDVGRNILLEGCVSLLTEGEEIKIWIGEFSPLNNLQTYLRAIFHLYQICRQKYFTRKLIVNTMGYITGLGELLVYEIYNIVQPKSVLLLQGAKQQVAEPSVHYALANIKKNISSGQYLDRVHLSRANQEKRRGENLQTQQYVSSCSLQHYKNIHAENKKNAANRFQKQLFGNSNIKDIEGFVRCVKYWQNSLPRTNQRPAFESIKLSQLQVYQQSRHNEHVRDQGICYNIVGEYQCIDMRVIVLGKFIQYRADQGLRLEPEEESTNKLIQVKGIGFTYEGQVYFSSNRHPVTEQFRKGSLIAAVSEGIDLQKSFYLIGQAQLIELELQFGRVPFISVIAKALGSKGTRNNPSKKA